MRFVAGTRDGSHFATQVACFEALRKILTKVPKSPKSVGFQIRYTENRQGFSRRTGSDTWTQPRWG